ncbi:hypothetical protein Anapl_15544 [Anas platyrhynchos]|uniref:Uncharacterized protein n=1 Tax=Anas platyrhynchos TaxID=8839 RepID=R0LMD9_ANAPL|nr:hypothetical protein Anapl_15544 [Anas platyrhynchos]
MRTCVALKSLCQQESKAKVAPFAGRGQGAERSTSSATASKSRGINQGKVGLRRAPHRSSDGAMEMNMKKFTVRRFFSVYLRKKSRSKSSSLSRFEVSSDVILLNVQSQVLPFCVHTEFLLKSAENLTKSMGTACVHPRDGLCLWFLLSVDEHECETIRRMYAQCGSVKDFEPQWNASYSKDTFIWLWGGSDQLRGCTCACLMPLAMTQWYGEHMLGPGHEQVMKRMTRKGQRLFTASVCGSPRSAIIFSVQARWDVHMEHCHVLVHAHQDPASVKVLLMAALGWCVLLGVPLPPGVMRCSHGVLSALQQQEEMVAVLWQPAGYCLLLPELANEIRPLKEMQAKNALHRAHRYENTNIAIGYIQSREVRDGLPKLREMEKAL